MSAKYHINRITDSFVLITDLDDGGSVTNNAASVVRELESDIEGGLGKRRIYYRDTTKRYDELQHESGQFTGFAPCSEHQQTFLKNLSLDSE